MRAVLLLGLLFPLQVHAYDFKGIEIGGSTTPEQVKEQTGVKCGGGVNGTNVCTGYSTIVGKQAFTNILIDAEGKVQRIIVDFDSNNYDQVAAALLQKFGEPSKREVSTVQNRVGGKFTQEQLRWEAGENQVLLERYSSKITKSMLYMSTEKDRAMLRSMKRENDKDI
jgi:hypothetical protein